MAGVEVGGNASLGSRWLGIGEDGSLVSGVWMYRQTDRVWDEIGNVLTHYPAVTFGALVHLRW